MSRRLIVFIMISLFIIISVPKNIFAIEWNLQITDPKDSPISADIKAIYMKDDNDNLYIKFESHKNWDFNSSESMAIYINTQNSYNVDDARYFLMINKFGPIYIGLWTDRLEGGMHPCKVDFTDNSTTGEATIPKNYADNKMKSFSFLCAIGSLDYDDFFVDIAPDDGMMKKYEKSPSKEKPKLKVEPYSIELGAIKIGETLSGEFEIGNDGGGSLDIKMTPSINSIVISPSQISLGEYDSSKIQIIVNTSSLTPNIYSESINITSNGGDYTLSVNFEVLKIPELFIENETIDFGRVMLGEKKSESIKIGNKHRGPINVRISSNSDWIAISKVNFKCESEIIRLSIISKKLDEGKYNGVVKVSSDGGNGEINVSMEIFNPLSVDNNIIDFGKAYSNNLKVEKQKISLTNISEETISVKIKSDSDWIKVDEYNFLITNNSKKELLFDVDFSKLTEYNKIYIGKITLDYGNETIELTARIEIVDIPPKMNIVMDDNTIEIKEIKESIKVGELFEKTIKITNIGSGVLKTGISISDTDTPLRLNKRNIILKQNESTNIVLSIDYQNVKPGNYSTTIVFDSNIEKREIPVNITFINAEILIKLYIGSTVAFIGDKTALLDSPPYIVKGTTMVPIRFISEAFGADVKWQNIGKGLVIITLKDKIITLEIGNLTAFINNEPKKLLTAPEIKNGRTFVPVRFISEGLGAMVNWDSVKQEILIKYNPI